MPRTQLKSVEETFELTIDGETESSVEEVGRVIQATPKTGTHPADTYIRLHLLAADGETNESYLWNDALANYDEATTDHDPATEARWVKE